MTGPSVRAEVGRLAAELDVDPGELAFLHDVPPTAIRDLRADLAEALHTRHEAKFRRLARLSHLAPAPITAKVAEVAFSPLLGARVAAVMEPEQAIRLAARLSPGFLTDVSTRLDPVRAEPIIRGLPVRTVVDVGRRLLEREEYLPLGRFVSVVDTDVALEVVEVASAEQMLAVALWTEEVAALDAVMQRLPDARLADVLAVGLAADARESAYDDLAAVLAAAGDATRARLLDLAAGLDGADATPLTERLP
ncbi:hypothetical protein EKO23_07030 [Nocardioides guangzhouensis]|uniref:Uncharacterized protein n=1 Tax=Nocardioides guangzhouensis TaxID=2497878 RepID=A0A4Q4ZFW5_9ACTN|nr:hypothetical protein [Nocardioides guangzhouensis]RYP87023.1 hypothetical protein EKO23_07030 [Nocardioides guangzhouensis]